MHPRKRMRDFQRLLNSIQSFSDNQANVIEWDEDQLEWLMIIVRPSDGYYMGGSFKFKIYFEAGYPKLAPRVDCLTPIYHPNIDSTCEDYNVCISVLDEWQDTFDLETVVQAILFLLYNPNLADPLSPYFDGESMSDEVFKENIIKSLEGGSLEGFTDDFPENRANDDVSEDDLAKGIELILEKACEWVAVYNDDGDDDDNDIDEEDEDVDSDDCDDKCDENENYDRTNLETNSDGLSTGSSTVIHADCKMDKCDCTYETLKYTHYKLWRLLPSWADVLVTVARICIDLSVGR